ncbi:methyltransferase domain-containing protein [Methylophaga sp. OBS1]|uniref:methyltransferase domain-containing protein n=1 Tax=Methylophaga sp. OBS1 TaxID=2991933 RepID=UPI002258A56A|nr:methyltransferase domain-containing protein [Methylophaga sp. OBS1]MCX4192762.1 methyltransferase domain-containing protein [Methylophaga sp. OBS1]
MSAKQDRNFDDLIDRFETRIYDTVKGSWRLDLLQQDLHQFTLPPSLKIWDAGCGQGQIALWLAGFGHQLTLCDLSSRMLDKAREKFARAGREAKFHHQSAQSLAIQLDEFDLVLCHAVIEWLADPLTSIRAIAEKVRPGGYLSLLFYNRNAMVYGNVLRGGWRLKPILEDSYLGQGHKLTPPNPQYPHELISIMHAQGFQVKAHTGIRVFHDYMSKQARENSDMSELFELEKRYCRLPAYRDMGRYVHLLLHRTDDSSSDGQETPGSIC